ncbi:MAG: hypothetical protein WCI22_17460, partial [Actinomycetota bacterium]
MWQRVALWLTGIGVLAVYAGTWRPIWYDELLHYALGAMSWQDALRTVDYTTIEVNHGQTGVYMLLDFALLKVFGANAVA